MNSVVRLGWLHFADVTLELCGRYGGVAGAWAAVGLHGHVREQIAELRARRMVAMMHRELRTLPEHTHAEALAELYLRFQLGDPRAMRVSEFVREHGLEALRDELKQLDIGVDFSKPAVS